MKRSHSVMENGPQGSSDLPHGQNSADNARDGMPTNGSQINHPWLVRDGTRSRLFCPVMIVPMLMSPKLGDGPTFKGSETT